MIFIPGCTITEKSRQKSSEQQEITAEPKSVVVDDNKKRSSAQYTFLDTINQGNEILLNDSDFGRNSQKSLNDISTSSSVSAETKYRVQVFASNRIETVREQKKELEKKITDPVVIGYEAPYYKLFTGSFLKRQDAQLILIKVKKLGFVDAWIVSTTVVPED
jgi:hypothetical protein